MLEGRGGGEIKEIDLRWEESSGGSRTLQTIEAQGSTQLTCGVRSAVGDRLSKGFPSCFQVLALGIFSPVGNASCSVLECARI